MRSPSHLPTHSPGRRRRGVTLVEMLVVTGLVVLMMTILVAVFKSASDALNIAQVNMLLDNDLRRIDTIVRQDLAGATARFTPPLDPADNLGYFEYAENALPDAQGEDADDTLAFTTQAPEGQNFTGRLVIPPPAASTSVASPDHSQQPITITSKFAEVIYFVRNNNLYRRVLLVVPQDRVGIQAGAPAINLNKTATGTPPTYTKVYPDAPSLGYLTSAGILFSWQGLNDISARPAASAGTTAIATIPDMPQFNTLGDLTERHNRFGKPRFSNDYITIDKSASPATLSTGPDGQPDDLEDLSGLPYFTSLPQSIRESPYGDGVPDHYPTHYPAAIGTTNKAKQLIYSPLTATPQGWSGPASNVNADIAAFPYVFPGAYSDTDPITTTSAYGRIHWLYPNPAPLPAQLTGREVNNNHSPLIDGDSLPAPTAREVFWGFPRWKETLLGATDPSGAPLAWSDPVGRLNVLSDTGVNNQFRQNRGFSAVGAVGSGNNVRLPDSVGNPANDPNSPFDDFPAGLWQNLWEEDLLMTGVRSFDVKILDANAKALNVLSTGPFTQVAPTFVDLGYGDMLTGVPLPSPIPSGYPVQRDVDAVTNSFAHEGRMPPLTVDFRSDSQWPAWNPNIGDDTTGVVRLRRVWDTWSTTYSKAPYLSNFATYTSAFPPYSQPIYPSYPPPYPQPMRALQITIRIQDPDNKKVRILTIRQDFTNKL